MLPSLVILSLSSLLPITYGSTSTSRTRTPSIIDLHLQPNYLENNKGSSIDYTTCEDYEAHDYEEYKDQEGEVCHYTHYEEMRIKDDFPGVLSCCPFHGHISSTENCQGRDKDGNEAKFKKAEVCVKPIEGEDNNIAGKINLNCKSETVKGVFEKEASLSTENKIQVLHVGQKNYTNFCIGIKCDSNDEQFEHQYEACEETLNTGRFLLPGTKCCGEGGKLHAKNSLGEVVIGNQECLEGEMTNEVRQTLELCKGKRVVVLEDADATTSEEEICVSETNQGSKKAICIDECETNKKCVQLCMGHGQAINKGLHSVPSKINLDEIFPGTLFINASLNKHGHQMENVMLYPDWRCQDAVDIQEDGSLRLKEKRSAGQVLHYGEFCIEPLDQDMERGKYRVKTSWVKEKEDEEVVEKEYVYYSVVLCISIVFLVLTIGIYVVYRGVLLKLMYNKIMINFAGSLLLAFLSLVVMQNLEGKEQTQSTCIGLTLLNQFAILSSFSLMTLMSYNIFIQLYQLVTNVEGFGKRVAFCYIIPGLITFVTLIVELTAPLCASVRPKIGSRSCHFYGGVDKFLWLYLPILLLLLVNTGMFVYIVFNICKTNSGSNSDGRVSMKRDKMLIYIRLFLGMGITWYFEILNFALSSLELDPRWMVLTDTLNMCQGIWVFIIFVCKRNVINVVSGKWKNMYNSVARQMSSRMTISTRPAKSAMSATSRTDDTSLSMSLTAADPHVDPIRS